MEKVDPIEGYQTESEILETSAKHFNLLISITKIGHKPGQRGSPNPDSLRTLIRALRFTESKAFLQLIYITST